MRAPYIVRTNRSRPAASAPNQNCLFGPFGQAELVGHRRQVRLVGRVPADPLGERPAEDREKDEHADDDAAADRRLVPLEARPEHLPRRAAGRLDAWEGDLARGHAVIASTWCSGIGTAGV